MLAHGPGGININIIDWMEKSGRRDVLRLVKITTHPSFPHGVCPSLVPSPGHLFFLAFFLGHIACDF